VRQVVVTGNPGPRLLLGGWLLERLNLSPAQVVLEPAEHVTMGVEAWAGGRQGRFRVERTGEERTLGTSVDIDSGFSVQQSVAMRKQWPALALAGALTQLGHDTTYEQAVRGARTLLANGAA
ncbi:MAG: OpcA/G6PD domain-containing protein, partial [Pseudonocardiaceae bacterium]